MYNERFQGEGWPDWAVFDDGLPAEPKSGFPNNYLVMPALQRSFDHFWANDPGPGGVGLQDRYAAAWRHVATRFKDNPNVFAYDLLNEPWPGTQWQECANPVGCPVADGRLADFNDRMFTAIRSVDPDTLVFYEPYVLFNFGADTTLRDTGDAHAGFSFHDYCLTAEQTPGDMGCNTFDSLVFQNADSRAADTGDALLLTEFGATDTHAVLRPVLELADQHMMSWQEWHYCPCDDPTTSGPGAKQAVVLDPARAPEGDNVKASTLGLLTRPYPRLVAGTPTGWSFDADTRAFAASWTTQRADGGGSFGPGDVTELSIPRRAYGDGGYSAAVQGGVVRSAPGAAVLRVSACSGADRVSVAVAPGGAGSTSTCAAPAGGGTSVRPRLRVALSPRVARAGRRVRVVARVRTSGRAVRGASVSLAGKRARTGRSGRAVFRVRFSRAGRRVAVARATGYRSGRATLRVRRAGGGTRRPSFTG
jgi:endoglycosylceramidase